MSNETDTGTRSNFASRLLNKAMSERKTTAEMKKVTVADAAQFANTVETEAKEPALAGKD